MTGSERPRQLALDTLDERFRALKGSIEFEQLLARTRI